MAVIYRAGLFIASQNLAKQSPHHRSRLRAVVGGESYKLRVFFLKQRHPTLAFQHKIGELFQLGLTAAAL
jgi:hypothetical protein